MDNNSRKTFDFYNGKKVLVTGHTGFKGAWMCHILTMAGAQVFGYALEAPTDPSVFHLTGLERKMRSVIGDIRDYRALSDVFSEVKPEIVIHMAAQPIVRESYRDPRGTYETNVMGTVNICECVRGTGSVRSFLNVTTDKVYLNREWEWAYREDEMLDGYDPYSNSKSCSELVTASYIRSFFSKQNVAVSTARAGNVIGGGDFSPDRIIPDCVRAVEKQEPIYLRNPASTRPYQHVLEPLYAYLLIAMRQFEDARYAGIYNVGPDEIDCVTTGELTELFCKHWGQGASWKTTSDNGPHEANFLKLDSSRMKRVFSWSPRWHVEEAVAKTVEWTKVYFATKGQPDASRAGQLSLCVQNQIKEYMSE